MILDVERRRGVRASGGEGGSGFHDAFATQVSIAFLPTVPRFILAAVFCEADQGCSIQPGLIDIKEEDAVFIERDVARAELRMKNEE